jgi:hypothetical protein
LGERQILIEKIKEQIMRWEGVTSGVHKFGGIEFRIGNRDMGHVHGDKLADLPVYTIQRV